MAGLGYWTEDKRSSESMQTPNLPKIERAMEPIAACPRVAKKGIDSVLYILSSSHQSSDIWDIRHQNQTPGRSDIIRERYLQEIKFLDYLKCLNSYYDVNSGNEYLKDTKADIDYKQCVEALKFHRYVCEHLFNVYSGNQNLSKSSSRKSLAEDGMKWVNRQPSSASPNANEAGRDPSWKLNHYETVYRNDFPSWLCRKSANKVTASNVSSRQNKVTVSNVSSRQRDSVVVADEAEMKQQMQSTIGAPDSVYFVLDSGSYVLPTGIPLYRHGSLKLNNLTVESSDKPRPNNAPATNPLHQTARTPVAHKRTDDDSEYHSNPNPRVADRGMFVKTKISDAQWYIATGAAHHATGNRHLFSLFEVDNSNHLCVHAADGTPMVVCGRGNVVTDSVLLSDVWYVPGLDVNLVSVGQLAELDYSIGFARGSCTISSAADTVVGRAHAREDGLYEVDFLRVPLGIP